MSTGRAGSCPSTYARPNPLASVCLKPFHGLKGCHAASATELSNGIAQGQTEFVVARRLSLPAPTEARWLFLAAARGVDRQADFRSGSPRASLSCGSVDIPVGIGWGGVVLKVVGCADGP